jgi:type II secretory ATPase GspE/PulE/Tfp pilus assembly ATPase PilB-like protein
MDMCACASHLLGQRLIAGRLISSAQLDRALARQSRTGEKLGQALLCLGCVSDKRRLLAAIADQLGTRYVDVRRCHHIHPRVLQKLPSEFASHYTAIPLGLDKGRLVVACPDPRDITVQDEIRLITRCRTQMVLAEEQAIIDAIRRHYGVGAATIDRMMGQTPASTPAKAKNGALDARHPEASMGHFLDQIMAEARQKRVTDIHLEPLEDTLRVRYRIDGVMHDAKAPANLRFFQEALSARVKVLANLDIAEKRLPQDGRFQSQQTGGPLDVRVSVLPSPLGESVVLRLLNAQRLRHMRDLGLSAREQAMVRQMIRQPHGIIFLTGPTGSGKTTTLYSCLSRINTGDKKIITLEDPVEYRLKGVIQVQVNPAIGLTFARGLRSMLRHDPDVMMVGEVRDQETAQIATRVALTGHLVFSTLHTNDAAGGVTRLLDMGVDPYLLTSTVECFIAQRLLRRVCPHCRQKVACDRQQLAKLGLPAPPGLRRGGNSVPVFTAKARGCVRCHGTGYQGRVAVYEFLHMTPALKALIMERATAHQIQAAAESWGMRTLAAAGVDKVMKGVTTLSEVIRVVQTHAP